MPVHSVQQGEYLTLIAQHYGIPWKKIWDDAANQELREKRKSPNVLHPGDKLHIPDLQLRHHDAPTEQCHKYRLRVGRNKVRLVVRDELGQPIGDLKYVLHLPGGKQETGKTASDGLIEADVPENVEQIQVVLPEINRTLELHVGGLDPVSNISGVQQRLENLGFDPGPIDGAYGPGTRAALFRFQNARGIKATGLADKDTRRELELAHEGASRRPDPDDDQGTGQTPSNTAKNVPVVPDIGNDEVMDMDLEAD